MLCDDHAVVRAGLRALLSKDPSLSIVDEANCAQAAVQSAARHRPDVLVLDLSMPGGGALEAIAQIRQAAPLCRVLVLSMHAAPEFVYPAIAANVSGYLLKGGDLAELLPAVRTVAAGGRFFSRELVHLQQPAPTPVATVPERLTPREREVLAKVALGHTNRRIALDLGLSVKTVETHRTNLMRKLDVHDAQGLTRFAIRHGLIRDD